MILEELIKKNKVPTLFIGSGISKRYLKEYPDWFGLLKKIAIKIGISPIQLNAIKNEIKNDNSELTNSQINAKLADYLGKKLNEIIINGDSDKVFSKEEQEKLGGYSTDYFKYLVAQEFSNYSIIEEMKSEVEIFKMATQKIGSVITTNYDNFLEKEIFTSFSSKYKQNQLYFVDSYEYECIYKIHGTVEQPDSIVINSNDYNLIEKNQRLFVAKMYNLLMSSPIIFLGYSLTDDDIIGVLDKFIECFDASQLNEIAKNIIMVSYKKGEKELIEHIEHINLGNKSIPITVIETDNYAKIYELLSKIELYLFPSEVNKYRKLLFKLLQDNEKGLNKISIVGDDRISSLDPNKVVVAIGRSDVISKIQKYGIVGLSFSEIVKKVLFRENLDVKLIVEDWYKNTANLNESYTLPVFYLAKNYLGDYSSQTKFNKNYIYLSNKFRKKITKICSSNISVDADEIKNYSEDDALGSGYKNIIYALSKRIITSEELRELLIKIFETNPNVISETSFKELVCFMDY